MRKLAILALALAVTLASARADDVDPEPPGASVQRLRGKWVVDRVVPKNTSKATTVALKTTYEFKGTKAFIDTGDGPVASSVKIDKRTKPPTLVLQREGMKVMTKTAFKIEKGELYLVTPSPWKGKQQKSDDVFDGKNGPVRVLKRAAK